MNWTAITLYGLGWLWFCAECHCRRRTARILYGAAWPLTVVTMVVIYFLPRKWTERKLEPYMPPLKAVIYGQDEP